MRLFVKAGLLVGTMDILGACLQYYVKTRNNPIAVLHYVASGAFGSKAYEGGISTAVWGLFFHFLIAFVFTGLFFLLYRSWPLFRRTGILICIIYGIFMWSVTQFMVIPLSRIPDAGTIRFSTAAQAIGILVICISIPLYYLARRSYSMKT
ncbi:MAG TPA: hypothetical protein VNQ55_05940 [Parapedobacter sp.]|nr:hypothetical protein [Parapedobacter sp.]